ncbi:MAG: family 78 glycoside hydrolase catalytic domain [Phycisphaerae bacterium]|nr:family 78 glycoside hydrolase catalytic domain [Phycisphaerae bacterium]
MTKANRSIITPSWAACLMLVSAGLAALPEAAFGRSGAPARLRCEYQKEPIAVDTTVPRFCWDVSDTRRGARQTAYQILVAGSLATLKAGQADLWDSGKVVSDQSVHVPYGGFPLRSGQQCFWQVRTWDADGVPSSFSIPATFEMGLRESADWSARWIHPKPTEQTAAGEPRGWKYGKWIWHPTAKGDKQTVYLRRAFELKPGEKVKQARIRCTADNKFTLFVNGKQIGSGNDWQQVCDYQVAEQLRPGKNVIAAAPWNEGSACGFRLDMCVDVEGKAPMWVLSEADWKASDREAPNWTSPDFDDSAWVKAGVIGEYGCQPWGGVKAAKKGMLRSVMMRKEFSLSQPARRIRRARAHVCGLGAYELRLNDRQVGRDKLTPGWTQFHKRVHYQTYDVTEMLRDGANAVGAILANGWWNGRIGGERDQPGRESLRMILQLTIEYADGSTQLIVTDPSWKTCVSPISRDSIYDGQTYDARLEKPEWDEPGFDDAAWADVDLVDQPVDNLVPQAKGTLQSIQDLPAVKVWESDPGVYVFDFGQNLTGWVRLKVKGNPGDKITIRHAEVMKDGKFYTANLRGAKATDVYVCKGGQVEVWEPQFTYHGFRYAEVTGYPGKPADDALLARMVSTVMPQIGRFECSNDVLNSFQECILWGARGNFWAVPTDCPQRDERLGWTGDAQMFCNTSCWNLDTARYYTKWMRDIADCQGPDGATRDVNPTNSTKPASPAWGDVCVIVPWHVYRHYGDTRIIEENYDCMVGWVEYMTKHSQGNLFERDGYGDWIAVVPSPKKPISAAYFYYDCLLLSKMARAIGRDADADKYAQRANDIRNAFNAKFLDTATGNYPGATQNANLLPLFFGVVPPHRTESVTQLVVDDVVKRRFHLSTGFLGTGYINPVLTGGGYHDLAWRLAKQTTYPSWGYMVKKGATTVWELWNSDTAGPGMNSRNHFCLGSVGEWYYESLAGILMTEPGFHEIRICPRPAGELAWVKASVWSVYGPIVSNWQRTNNDLHMQVTIPANTTARILVPTFGAEGFAISESGRTLVKDGRYADSAEGLTFVGMEGDFAAFRTGAGSFRFIAHGVGAPPAVAYNLPPAPPVITKLVDDFSAAKINAAKWDLIDLGLESVAASGIAAGVADGQLVFSGATGVNYWAGKTLRSKGAFNVPKGKRLEVQIDRVALEPKGSGARTSLWLWADSNNHVMFSQDTEVGTWSYNADGHTGNGVELTKASDAGRHTMKLVHDGENVTFYLDDKKVGSVKVGWNEGIQIAVTGQARQKGDAVVARFDNVKAEIVE